MSNSLDKKNKDIKRAINSSMFKTFIASTFMTIAIVVIGFSPREIDDFNLIYPLVTIFFAVSAGVLYSWDMKTREKSAIKIETRIIELEKKVKALEEKDP